MNDVSSHRILQSSTDPNTPLLEAGRNCCSITHAKRAAVIVDAQAYFQAFAEAAERAERSIMILAWDFNSRVVLSRDPSSPYHTTLGDFLNRLARKRKRLHIRILDWDFPLVFGTDREMSPLYGLTWTPHRRIHFHYDATHPLAGSHHQKIVVIDDKIAFNGGLDLTCRRWDTPDHAPQDPRRVDNGKPYPPFHDVMVAVDGSAAQALAEVARNRWARATGERIAAVGPTQSDAWPRSVPVQFNDVTVGVACTAPAGDGTKEVRDIEQLYIDMIARARHYIFLENQYFTSSRIGEALAARLDEPRGPEIIVISRLLSHGWLEEITMQALRTRMIRALRAKDRNNRFHIYYPHVEGLVENTCVDIHSKVAIVDDAWLRVGSANISNRSMGLDTECDLLIDAAGSTAVASRIRSVRDTLIAEHLGVPVDTFAERARRAPTLNAAIESLQSNNRTLKPLPDESKWPDEIIDAASIADPERPVSLDSLVEQFSSPVQEPRRGSLLVKAAIVGAILAALMLLWHFTPLSEYTSPELISAQAEAFARRWWAPAVIVAAYTPASVLMFPRPLITLAAVVAFGPLIGCLYAVLGIVLAALAGYLAGRMLPRDTVRRIAGERVNKISRALRSRGLLAMILVRIVPVAPFVVVSMVAGAVRIKVWHFAIGTVLGMLPGVLAATVFGQQVQTGLADPSKINYWLLGGVVLLLAGGAFAVHRWLRRASAEDTDSRPQGRAQTRLSAPCS